MGIGDLRPRTVNAHTIGEMDRSKTGAEESMREHGER